MNWNLIGAALGAVILVVFFLIGNNDKNRRQRLAIYGFGLGFFALPTYGGSVLQDLYGREQAARESAAAETRMQARFDHLGDQLNDAFRGILAAMTDPRQSPKQRQAAVAAAVGHYNTVLTKFRGGPIKALPIPSLDTSTPPAASRQSSEQPTNREAQKPQPVPTPTPTPTPANTRDTTEPESSPPAVPIFIPPPVIVPPPPVIIPPPPPP